MANLKKILVDSFAMKDEEFIDHQSLNQLKDFDSMNHMFFVTNLEEEFGIDLTGDEIIAMRTIGDIKKLLLDKNIDPLS